MHPCTHVRRLWRRHTHARVEAGLANAEPRVPYQFERLGYFCRDASDHEMDARAHGVAEQQRRPLRFNRIVPLKASW